MVKSDILSAAKANRLYWLGRYEERVYMTLHLMGKCYDRMIDGKPDDYSDLWRKLDMSGKYCTQAEFEAGMLYDEHNPCSLLSAQKAAMDNAILLREDILSETLSYIEMSLNLMREGKERKERNITALQPVIDWTMAFWGSAEQRVQNHRALSLILTGRNVEDVDIKIRFGYPFRRVALAYESLTRCCRECAGLADETMAGNIRRLLTAERFDPADMLYKYELLKYVNQLVRV